MDPLYIVFSSKYPNKDKIPYKENNANKNKDWRKDSNIRWLTLLRLLLIYASKVRNSRIYSFSPRTTNPIHSTVPCKVIFQSLHEKLSFHSDFNMVDSGHISKLKHVPYQVQKNWEEGTKSLLIPLNKPGYLINHDSASW